MKKRIGIFASTLHQKNPRGACRAARSFAEALSESDEFEFLCLTERINNQHEITFRWCNLQTWLLQNPMQQSGSNCFQNTVEKVEKALCPPALTWLLKHVRRLTSRLLSSQNSDAEYNRYVTLGELDGVLSFWWFPVENFYFLPLENYSTKIIGWFLDGIPLRMNAEDYAGVLSLDDYMREVSPLALKASKIICISKSAENDLNTFFAASRGKTCVVHLAHQKERFQQSNPQANLQTNLATVLSKYDIDDELPYFIAIGVHEPSKNIVNILRACTQVARAHPALKFQLLLVGLSGRAGPEKKYGYFLREARKQIRVTSLGYVPDEELAVLLSGAKALLYPSLWEGFGIPPLEAMSAGTLVVTSNLSSLPEVCGENAIYCDPFDPMDIGEATRRCLEMTDEERQQRIRNGQMHASSFSWERAAEELLKVLRDEFAVVKR
jgi:glycosyltransferase involved in cell wall biosynthesis